MPPNYQQAVSTSNYKASKVKNTFHTIKIASPQPQYMEWRKWLQASRKLALWGICKRPLTGLRTLPLSEVRRKRELSPLPVNRGLKETGEKALWVLVNLGFLGGERAHRECEGGWGMSTFAFTSLRHSSLDAMKNQKNPSHCQQHFCNKA